MKATIQNKMTLDKFNAYTAKKKKHKEGQKKKQINSQFTGVPQ